MLYYSVNMKYFT